MTVAEPIHIVIGIREPNTNVLGRVITEPVGISIPQRIITITEVTTIRDAIFICIYRITEEVCIRKALTLIFVINNTITIRIIIAAVATDTILISISKRIISKT